MEEKSFIVEVEPSKPAKEGKPSIGPVYRSIFAKDGFPPPIPGLDSCWDILRLSVEKYPENRMLGRREMVNGKPGKYSWMTYKEVYDIVLKVGNSIRSCGIEEGGHCGIYGANCPEWVMSMEACNAHGLYCVPLYDTLGAGAVEFIICHAEVTLAFVEEKKNSELLKTFPGAAKYLKTIVSFGKVTSQQKEDVEKFGVAIYSWDDFMSLDVKLLVEDIVELQPSVFCAVLGCTMEGGVCFLSDYIVLLDETFDTWLTILISGLQQKISSGGLIKQTAFNFSYSLKLRNMRNGFKQSVASPICDKLVFNLVKQGLGGNVRLILSGAAPLGSHVEEYLRVVTCSYVLQGYGLTETCAGTFVSIPDEMNMLGYYKREDLTKEVLIDGWFHTGDIGEWQPNGSLKIIDRKKNIFKLSQGEYVAVENLENIYSLVPDIESIWVYGNSFESFLVAIINPSKQAVEQWAKQNSISGDFNVKGFEFIKAIHLDPVPFDMERDLITPTYKKKRPQLLKSYQHVQECKINRLPKVQNEYLTLFILCQVGLQDELRWNSSLKTIIKLKLLLKSEIGDKFTQRAGVESLS
ncbi:Long chain acyl-CoA synthetase 5 [Sesamum angolense]|uniref:Long chain acyl-CoA synthetase 5 n=1 Tax=Sesamum angolense TaxID=2727404 RepID=A0AAE1WWY1_9LAMI|nr:Long chain acyl-CoA synthetase 5 [Sesamum angolense]